MATQPLGRPFTYQDYLELPDNRNRYEILDGELTVSPAPSVGHQGASIGLSSILYFHVSEHGLNQSHGETRISTATAAREHVDPTVALV